MDLDGFKFFGCQLRVTLSLYCSLLLPEFSAAQGFSLEVPDFSCIF